ncbi:MAG: nidogen-like domain-containing protein [Cyanobacteriota bacterium]|nr:nidogen-like domain-containing protein [Cyanobacteriota bacterium]
MASLISGLGGVAGYGELSLLPNDDSFQSFDISSIFENGAMFFGVSFDSIFVNNNGSITFGSGVSQYTPEVLTAMNFTKMIAPFWADVDTRGTGAVYVDLNEVADTVTVTWLNVGYYDQKLDKTNSFQLVLKDLEDCGFVAEFRYANINWTTGDASGGTGGLGGTIATAGWTAGDGENFFSLPQSGSQSGMLNLETIKGNSGKNGIWQFLIDDDVINTGGNQTSAQLFSQSGMLPLFSDLALAAYSLDDHEVVSVPNHPSNDPSAAGDAALASLGSKVKWLTALDLTSLTPEVTDNELFPVKGLCNGLYLNENAAARVGRSADSLFLAFRGTNDNSVGASLWSGHTPDVDHWTAMGTHFALFSELITALRTYANTASNGIRNIYVVGHSLGAGMVEALMDNWADPRITAVTFASPGYGIGAGNDARITNFWTEGDAILGAAFFADNEGDENMILHNATLPPGSTEDLSVSLHSMKLYQAYMHFFREEGIDLAAIRPGPDRDFDDILCESVILDTAGSTFSIATANDKLQGDSDNELLLGGAGRDRLFGFGGNDWLIGGTAADVFYGGKGSDTLTGGMGPDKFVFKPSDEALTTTTTDVITDFLAAVDQIDLRDFDTDLLRSGRQPLIFIGGAAFSGSILTPVAGEVRFAGNHVEIDRNGNGIAELRIEIQGGVTIAASDLLL